jgi:ABC-type dipeptide/oligopeptide/nickel transport system permease subunit
MSAEASKTTGPGGSGKGSFVPVGTVGAIESGPTLTLWSDAWRRLRKNRLALVGAGLIIIMVLIALLAPIIATHDPVKQSLSEARQGPSLHHFFGTNVLGQDMYSRMVYGARISLSIGVLATLLSIVAGVALGAIAGYFAGWSESIIMRLADIFFAFPYVLGAIVIVTAVGRSFASIFVAIGILGWATVARLFRSSVLSVKGTEYVDAARAIGAGDWRIITRHILPNAFAPVLVYGTMSIGGAILAESALSFLGLGVRPPAPAWGSMVADGMQFMETVPWLVIFPGLFIVLTVLGFVLLGDGLRDSLDPRLR